MKPVNWILGAAVLAMVGYAVYPHLVSGTVRQEARTSRILEDAKRLEDWAYVAKKKEVAPGETVKLVVIPSSIADALDTKCLIYTNQEFRQSSIICPDAKADFIEDQ